MAQNVTIAGASYPAVPGIEVPITNGGGIKAYFADTSPTTATDADVAQGKIYFKADGSQSVGTGSGSGSGAVIIEDAPDAAGGTVRTITAITVSGTKTITQNGTGIDVTEYAAVDVNVPSSQPNLQAKTNVNPSTSSFTVMPDPGFDALSSVQINAMPSGAVTSPSTISGTAASVSTGTNTLTLTKTVSVTPNVTTAGYISSGTAGNASVSLSANVSTKAAATITPTTSQQTIAAGTYLTGAQTIAAIPSQYIIPSGSQTITQNGTVDVTSLASVIVNVSGGGGVGTLLNTTSLGSISSSSTQAASLNISLEVTGINSYDLLIVESSVNSVTNNRHTATVGVIFLTASSAIGTKNGATIATAKWNSKISSNGTTTTNVNTTAYGIYPNSCSVSSGTATIPMYRRYNSTSTGTINGTYTARVYGVNLYDLIGG